MGQMQPRITEEILSNPDGHPIVIHLDPRKCSYARIIPRPCRHREPWRLRHTKHAPCLPGLARRTARRSEAGSEGSKRTVAWLCDVGLRPAPAAFERRSRSTSRLQVRGNCPVCFVSYGKFADLWCSCYVAHGQRKLIHLESRYAAALA